MFGFTKYKGKFSGGNSLNLITTKQKLVVGGTTTSRRWRDVFHHTITGKPNGIYMLIMTVPVRTDKNSQWNLGEMVLSVNDLHYTGVQTPSYYWGNTTKAIGALQFHHAGNFNVDGEIELTLKALSYQGQVFHWGTNGQVNPKNTQHQHGVSISIIKEV